MTVSELAVTPSVVAFGPDGIDGEHQANRVTPGMVTVETGGVASQL
jgi:hypothetical protein